MTPTNYEHIWDCCCDHGFLGASLLSRQTAPNIHFVDIVPELIDTLKHKLQRFYADSSVVWTAQCINVKELPLAQHQGKHLVIIAGIGGDLMIELVSGIYRNNPTIDIDFLLCPVHHQFNLRKQLIALNFSLKDEVLIEENKRFYEILFVSTARHQASNECSKNTSYQPISPIGDKMWKTDSSEQEKTIKKYLNKTLNHYQRIQQGNKSSTSDIAAIIEAYQKQQKKTHF